HWEYSFNSWGPEIPKSSTTPSRLWPKSVGRTPRGGGRGIQYPPSTARRPRGKEPAAVDVWDQGEGGGPGPHALRARCVGRRAAPRNFRRQDLQGRETRRPTRPAAD